jgi:putative alpha-1,2-mannosidase
MHCTIGFGYVNMADEIYRRRGKYRFNSALTVTGYSLAHVLCVPWQSDKVQVLGVLSLRESTQRARITFPVFSVEENNSYLRHYLVKRIE